MDTKNHILGYEANNEEAFWKTMPDLFFQCYMGIPIYYWVNSFEKFSSCGLGFVLCSSHHPCLEFNYTQENLGRCFLQSRT